MNIVIPLAQSSNDFIDLRYALRSVCYIYNPERLIIIGAEPEWIKDHEYQFYPDAKFPKLKELNILRKTIAGLSLCNEALVVHDDHFIFAPVQPWYCDSAQERLKTAGKVYRSTIRNTIKITGKDAPWFDVHAPFFANVDSAIDLLGYDWTRPYGYGLKTLYFKDQPGVLCKDIKLDAWEPVDNPFFSISGKFNDWAELEKLWPEPSKYE